MLNLTQPPRAARRPVLRATGLVGAPGASVDVAPLPSPRAAPETADAWRDALGLLTGLRLPAAAPRLARVPRGDGHVVIDIPGWKAPETTGAPLRRYLRLLGYDARGWGRGTNQGNPEADAEALIEQVLALTGDGSRVTLVGWSLGGVIAREVARRHPEAVRHVVTYGTPVVGGPTFTVGARSYGRAESERIARLTEELDRDDPVRTPLTVIFTRRDRIVSWEACLDRTSPDVEHFEVGSTHLGLGLDPDVWTRRRRLAAVR